MPVFYLMDNLKDILTKQIMIFDGSMGTMIQSYNLTENDFRGKDLMIIHMI